MEVYALEFYRRHKCQGIFKSEDAAYILSFAIMMLHTSLHNPSVKTRTSKKQWISMNRGTNDGENFPDDVLLDIFDRIQATEFETGRDHTYVVADIKKQITGSTIQKLSTPQRYLVHCLNVMELQELNARPSFRIKHRRTIFFFNNIMVVCKRRHNQEYAFKESFSLLGILPVKFETHYYKCGIQLHAVDGDTPYQFNCDSSSDREHLVQCLEIIVMQLKVLDIERIAELGNTLSTNTNKQELDAGGHTRTKKHTLSCDAGDLISSVNLTLPDSSPSMQHRGDFIPGVEDLALSTTVSSSVMTRHMSENRISRDSGFDSQQLTPTPPPSPPPAWNWTPAPRPLPPPPTKPPHSPRPPHSTH